jgi:hypothetical protein
MAILPRVSRDIWSSVKACSLRPSAWAEAVAGVVERVTEDGLELGHDDKRTSLPVYSRRGSGLVASLGVVALLAAIAWK